MPMQPSTGINQTPSRKESQMKGSMPFTLKSSSLEVMKIPTPSPDRLSTVEAPSMLEGDRSARKLNKLKDLENG